MPALKYWDGSAWQYVMPSPFPPKADVSFGGYKATLLANPVNPQDAATKAYVDAGKIVAATPPTPSDGLEYYLQNAQLEAQGCAWQMRYRSASSSAYKWEFVGGAPWRSANFSQRSSFNTATVTTWNRLDSPVITLFTAPRDGDYWVTGQFIVNIGNASQFWLALMRDGAVYGSGVSMTAGGAGQINMLPFGALINMAAGSSVGIMAATNNVVANFGLYGQSNYQVVPIRLA